MSSLPTPRLTATIVQPGPRAPRHALGEVVIEGSEPARELRRPNGRPPNAQARCGLCGKTGHIARNTRFHPR